MHGKAFLMMLAAGACSHAGPAGATGVACRSVAKAQSIAGMGADEACGIVRERTLAALGTGAAAADIIIELDLSHPRSIVARIWYGGAGRALPEVAVDVMDRALRREDVVRLADAVAQAVAVEARTD